MIKCHSQFTDVSGAFSSLARKDGTLRVKYAVHSVLFHFLRFSADDGNGGVAAADVLVNMCDCTGHGDCRFDRIVDGFKLKDTFRIVECNCSIGWEGEIYLYIGTRNGVL